jgi:colicin import membrane protein
LQQQKAAQEQRARADAEARQLRQLAAEQAGAERKRGLAEYIDKVRGKIRGNISLPPGIQGNPQAEFEVTQLPTGEVLDVKLRRSSGNPALDAAVERAIRKSSPLAQASEPGSLRARSQDSVQAARRLGERAGTHTGDCRSLT